MKSQNGEFGDSRVKPVEKGVSGAAARLPDGGSFERASGNEIRKKRANPRFQSVSEMSIRKLKRLHGEGQGRNLAVEEELRRRGFNAQMLAEIQWEYDQRRWEKTIRQLGSMAAAGAQGKEYDLAKWRRLPIKV
jgi:hypothetical protein